MINEDTMNRNMCVLRAAIIATVLLLGISGTANAQFAEDAQRLAISGLGGGARALGSGNAFIGVADDFSALLWNPAGLAQARWGEFSFGLSYLMNKDNSTFFNSQSSYSSNGTNLNTLGFVLPLPAKRGSASIAFGFTRQAIFKSGVAFDGYNTVSSIVQTYAQDGKPAGSGYADNLAYQLYLANFDTVTGNWDSKITKNVQQQGTATETGGLNNWMFGGAMDVARNLSVGITATYISGSYRYDRNFKELDPKFVHLYPFDIQQITLDDFIEDDISGYNVRFGLMYREPEKFRVGITVKTPTWFSVKEDYGNSGSSIFRTADNQGNVSYGPVSYPGSTSYHVETPWVFGVGGSVILRDLTVSGDAEYADWTQTKFSNAPSAVLGENATFATRFQGTWNFRGGLQYQFRPIGLVLRGGFIYNPSIFKNDPTSNNQKFVTGGAGIDLGEASTLDFAIAHGWWMSYRVNYDNTSLVDEKLSTNTFLLTLTHHF